MTSRLASLCRHRAKTSVSSPLASCASSPSPRPCVLRTQNPGAAKSISLPSCHGNGDYNGSSSDSSSQNSLPIAACLGFAVLAAQKDGDALVMEVKKAKLNEAREKFSLAEEHYHAALRINDEQRNKGEVDEMQALSHRAWILDAMANLAIADQKPYKAEKLFKEVLQIIIQMGAPQESPPVLEISIKLANLFAVMEEEDKRKEADIGFKFAISSQRKTVDQMLKMKEDGEDIPDTVVKEAQALLGWALQSYASYLLEERRKPEAVELFQESSEIAKAVYGEESESYATMLNDAASALADKNLFEEATTMLEKSIVLSKGKGWEAEPAFRINLGIISIHRRLFADAEKHCNAGMELAVKLKSSDAVEEAARCLSELKKAVTGVQEPEAECTAAK